MRPIIGVLLGVVLALSAGCLWKAKPKPLVPLPLDGRANQQAVILTEQGTAAYRGQQFDDAKAYFEQALSAAPQVGATHYNLALVLNALGDTQSAHDQFLEAATLEPGHKVIWDSPALRPYGNPEGHTTTVGVPQNAGRRSATGGMTGGGIGSPR